VHEAERKVPTRENPRIDIAGKIREKRRAHASEKSRTTTDGLHPVLSVTARRANVEKSAHRLNGERPAMEHLGIDVHKVASQTCVPPREAN
jgi:hypothetical protein